MSENAGAEIAGDRNPKKRRGGVSCGAVHPQAREMVSKGHSATLVAGTLAICRSSLYRRKKPRGSRADRTYDEQIVMACGEKVAYGHRRVAWWLQRKTGLPVNRKRVLRVMVFSICASVAATMTSPGETEAGTAGMQPC